MPHKNLEIKKQYFKEYYKKNKEKLDLYRTQYKENNPISEQNWQNNYREKSIEKRRDYTIKSRYNLTRDQFDAMREQQQNKCSICQTEFSSTPHIDHNHTTGEVRSLLCCGCNTGLGVYENKKELFENYLKEYNGSK